MSSATPSHYLCVFDIRISSIIECIDPSWVHVDHGAASQSENSGAMTTRDEDSRYEFILFKISYNGVLQFYLKCSIEFLG